MRRLILLLLVALPVLANESLTGWCEKGGETVTTAGVKSTTKVQGSHPQCTVTVFISGTTTKATIYSDVSNTPLSNPFTAGATGYWAFYAANGRYDVQMASAGFAAPFTVGDVLLFDLATYAPHNVFAYPTGNVPGVVAVYNGAQTFYGGFTVNPTISSNLVWTLPTSDTAGCLQSDGGFQLSIVACSGGGASVGGPANSIQFNNAGALVGDPNFIWDSSAARMTLTGVNATQAMFVSSGYAQFNGGIFTQVNNWQGAINTNTDGGLLRGLHIDKNIAGTAGGYINIAPINGVPLPLPGLSAFGVNTALIWVGGTNGMAANTLFGLNTNLFINASGGFQTQQLSYNSIQSTSGGGMFANSFTALHYIQSGHSSGAPTPTQFDNFQRGALYFDDVIGAEQVFNGSNWVTLGGGGGGGSPGGPTNAVQFNAGSSTFGGSANMSWNGTLRLLTITTADAAHAGISIANGFAQSDTGFFATNSVCVTINCFNAPTGGVNALAMAAVSYVQVGNAATAPTAITNDTLHAGALSWNCGGSACVDGIATGNLQVWNGAAWIAVATGGATSPGGTTTNVQFNSGGSFAGSNNFTWNNAARLLTVIPASSSFAGISVVNGFIQSDTGFLATNGTCVTYNCFNAPTGGGAALSFTAVRYVQVGSSSSDPTAVANDTFHPGALYYNTVSGLRVYNGTAFVGITGGSGTPGGANTQVQFNSAGTFGGSPNFTWNNGTQQLFVGGIAGTAGITVQNAWVIADSLISQNASYNAIQSSGNFGGMAARSFTAAAYVQVGNNGSGNAVPTATTNDTFHYGALYYNVGIGALQVCTQASCTGGVGGVGWQSLSTSSAGVTSLNGLGGALTLVGTLNEITISPSGSTITIATPQPIAVTSNPTFGNILANGAFTSSASGSAIAFQTSSFSIQMTGAGNLSTVGVIASNGGIGVGGFNITANTSNNSYQTVGGVNVSSGGNPNGVYQVHGVTVIDSNRALQNITAGTINGALQLNGILNANSGIISAGGIQATGYNVTGGFIGQTWTINIPGGFSCTGTACPAGTAHNLVFRGGVLVSGS